MRENDPASRPTSRLNFVGAVGTGVAAAAITALRSPAEAQSQAPPAAGGTLAVRNPATAYFQGPYPAQQQPWPGLQSRMQPRPDCGETSYRGTGRLVGRRALVTGGDSGIGRAAAIAFAREGADVAINYLPQEEPDAREVIAVIRQSGRRAFAIPGDIRSEAFCTHLVTEAAQQLGGLDILAQVAGRQHALETIEELTTDLFDWTLKTNVYAMHWIDRAAVAHMQPGAAIIHAASEQAYSPSADLLDYASTKAFIANYTKALGKQLAKRGIRVNAIAPGPVWTPLQVVGGQPPDKIPSFGSTTPLGRAGQPVEMAPVFVTLAAPDQTYATAQIYGANGGNGVPG